jgi:hypothetical protein
MASWIVIGIDPGTITGLAAVTVGRAPEIVGTARFAFDKPRLGQCRTPTEEFRHLLIRLGEHSLASVCVEDCYVGSPKSSIVLARRAGRWTEAAAETTGREPVLIHASTWQTTQIRNVAALLGKGKVERGGLKAASRKIAAAYWPDEKLSEHTSDAALMARHAAILAWHASLAGAR